MPVNVKRRKRNVILYGAAAVLTAIVIVVTVAMSTFETLGYGSVGNTIATNGALIGLILTTLALIGLARLYTPKGGITSWRRIGTIGLTLWVVIIVYYLLTYATRGIPGVGPALAGAFFVPFFSLPSLFWFPLWVVIAAIRGSMHPERMAPARAPRETSALTSIGVPEVAGSAVTLPETYDLAAAPGIAVPNAAGSGATPTTSPPAPATGDPVVRREHVAGKAIGISAGVLVLLGALAVGGYVADQWKTAQELDALITQIEVAESAQREFISIEVAAFEKGQDADYTDASIVVVVQTIASGARDTAIKLNVAQHDLEALSYLPWHAPVQRLRDDYTDHVDAWLVRLLDFAEASTIDDLASSGESTDIGIASTWEIVGNSADRAAPTMFAGDLPARLKAIFHHDDQNAT